MKGRISARGRVRTLRSRQRWAPGFHSHSWPDPARAGKPCGRDKAGVLQQGAAARAAWAPAALHLSRVRLLARRGGGRRCTLRTRRTPRRGPVADPSRRRPVAHPRQGLSEHPLQRPDADHGRQRGAPAAGVDLLHRHPPRARGRAAGRREHDVRGEPVSQPAVRAGPAQRRRPPVDVRAPAAARGAGRGLLRRGEPRRLVRPRQGLLQHARQPDGRRGRGDRQGGVAHAAGRPAAKP